MVLIFKNGLIQFDSIRFEQTQPWMNSPLMHYAMILILSRHCKRLAARTARKMTNGVALGWC